jgi:hypothetical protein
MEQGINHRCTQEPGHYGRGNWDPGGKNPPEDRGRQRERPEAGIHDSRPGGGGRRVTGVCILTALLNRGKGRVQKWARGWCRNVYALRVWRFNGYSLQLPRLSPEPTSQFPHSQPRQIETAHRRH